MTIDATLTGKFPVTDKAFSDIESNIRPYLEIRVQEVSRTTVNDNRCTYSLAVPPELATLVDTLEVGNSCTFEVVGARLPNGQFVNLLFLAGIHALVTEVGDDWQKFVRTTKQS